MYQLIHIIPAICVRRSRAMIRSRIYVGVSVPFRLQLDCFSHRTTAGRATWESIRCRRSTSAVSIAIECYSNALVCMKQLRVCRSVQRNELLKPFLAMNSMIDTFPVLVKDPLCKDLAEQLLKAQRAATTFRMTRPFAVAVCACFGIIRSLI